MLKGKQCRPDDSFDTPADDWHVHLRDGAVMRSVCRILRRSSRARLSCQPVATVTSVKRAPPTRPDIGRRTTGCYFTPLITAYLTDATDGRN